MSCYVDTYLDGKKKVAYITIVITLMFFSNTFYALSEKNRIHFLSLLIFYLHLRFLIFEINI